MKKAVFEYRCRRCGFIEKEYQIDLPDGESMAQLLLFNVMRGRTKPTEPPSMFSIHLCSKFERGISDLFGYQIEG